MYVYYVNHRPSLCLTHYIYKAITDIVLYQKSFHYGTLSDVVTNLLITYIVRNLCIIGLTQIIVCIILLHVNNKKQLVVDYFNEHIR